MIKNFKLLALTLVMSLGCLNGFAAELIGAEIFNTNNKLKYKIVSIDQYSKTGTCYILSNNLPASTETLNIEQTFVWTVSGEISSVPFTDDVEWTVVGIGDQAFKGLNFLKTVKVPATVQYIGTEAFLGCGVIEKFSIAGYEATQKSDLERIGDYAFGNTGLKEIDLSGCPKLDLSTGKPFTPTATDYNVQLAKVTLPAELKSVGIAFRNCAALKTINLEDTQAFSLDGGVYPTGGAFAGCASLKSITIPADAVAPIDPTTVGDFAFLGCSKLESVTFKGKLAAGSLALNSFSYVDGTTPKGATSIKTLTFDGELAAGAIPGDRFNNSQKKLQKIYFNGDLTGANAVGTNAFGNGTDKFSALEIVEFNGDITATGAVASNAFLESGSIEAAKVSVSFNGDITAMGAVAVNAFSASNLTELTVANLSIQAGGITAGAFTDCAALATVNYGDLLIAGAIPMNMFDKTNAKLATLNFKNDLTVASVISQNAFYDVPLTAVNFNGAIKVNPFVVGAFQRAGYVNNGTDPWHKTTKGFVATFNGDITAAGNIGSQSFAYSYVKEVVIGENAKVAENAFASNSFLGTGDYWTDQEEWAGAMAYDHLFNHVKYLPKDADAKMIFAQDAFANTSTDPYNDVVLTTTEKVKFLYQESVSPAIEIYRVEYQVVSYISDLKKDINSDNYYGKFTPKPNQYIIPRYQDNDAVVTVYSAYYDKNRFNRPEYEEDGKTLKNNGTLDLYMNPLRLQTVKDFNGKFISAYVIDANEVVIIRNTKDQKVQIFEDVDDNVGSIQTIVGYSAHECNDLRYSAADRNEWAVQNNYTDDYTANLLAPYAYDPDNNWDSHNILNKYEIWVWLNPAKKGFAFGHYKSLYTGDVYVLGVKFTETPAGGGELNDPAARLNIIWTDGSGDDNEVTAILNKVVAKQKAANEGIYTLQGVRTNAARKGIYIKDGKKVIVK